MNRNRFLIGLSFTLLLFGLSSCYTMNKVFNSRGQTPIFLHADTNLNGFTFYIDGKEASPEMMLYKSREVSRTSTTVTIEQTSIPAIAVSNKKAYVVLKIVNNRTKKEHELLLKSDLKDGAKLIMYFQGMMTAGVGNLIDLSTNSIYGWPEIPVD
jgi:hypothetical protein